MSVETIASPTGFLTKYLHWHVYKIYGVFYIENILDKGHEAKNLQKECLFLLLYHFPMEDSSESFEHTLIHCCFNIEEKAVQKFW